MKNDYSLLRPFDADRARAGEPICTMIDEARTFIAGPDAAGRVITETYYGHFVLADPYYLRMAPLCWAEGKPVYKGDKLYLAKENLAVVAISAFTDRIYASDILNVEQKFFAKPNEFSWDIPAKTKRQGWVNIYRDCITVGPAQTKELADASAQPDRVACVMVEWDE